MPKMNGKNLLTVVVPVFNEEEVLSEFQRRIREVLADLDMAYELLYVNDGSTDDTIRVLETCQDQDCAVSIVDLSRNFGKEIALTAGLDHARGDAVVVIDADLQDPPELIPRLIEEWKAGNDVVYARRVSRDGESVLKKSSAHVFYRMLRRISDIEIPADTGDFRLLSRRAVDALCNLRERHRYMKGLFAWIGFRQKAVLYRRDARLAGVTKWNYVRLLRLAIEGITSFTTGPLKLATYLGLATSFTSFVYALIVVYKTLVYGDPVAGYPSLMVVVLLLGGVQLLALGIIGEYLGRTFNETKTRPLYLVNSYRPSKANTN